MIKSRDDVERVVLQHALWLYDPAYGERANLSGWDLSSCDLSGCDLSDAILRGANLTGADLSNTSLYNANLYGANLYHALIRDTILCGPTVIDVGADSRGYRFIAIRHDDGLRIAAGCRWFTMLQARLHWQPATECWRKVDAIKAEARARRWLE